MSPRLWESVLRLIGQSRMQLKLIQERPGEPETSKASITKRGGAGSDRNRRAFEPIARCRQRVQHGFWSLSIDAASKQACRAVSNSHQSSRDLPRRKGSGNKNNYHWAIQRNTLADIRTHCRETGCITSPRSTSSAFLWALLVSRYLSQTASLVVCAFRRVKDHHNLLHASPLLKLTCVRQVVLDKWLSPICSDTARGARGVSGVRVRGKQTDGNNNTYTLVNDDVYVLYVVNYVLLH